MNSQYHNPENQYNSNAQSSYRGRAQTAPSSSSPPLPPKPPPLPSALIPGFVRPPSLNSRADLAFESNVRKDWTMPHYNTMPSDFNHYHHHPYAAPPIPPRPYDEPPHPAPSPPIPPKHASMTSNYLGICPEEDDIPDLPSPAFPQTQDLPPSPATELPPRLYPPDIDTSISRPDSRGESQEETEQSLEESAKPGSSITESPTVDSPVDDDVAEAIRRSLLPAPPPAAGKTREPEDDGLANAVSSWEVEDATEAKERADREKLDEEFARRLQLEMESEPGPSTSSHAPSSPVDEKEGASSEPDKRQSDFASPPSYFQTVIPPTPSTSGTYVPPPPVPPLLHSLGAPDDAPSRPSSPYNPIRRAISANAVIETPTTLTSMPVVQADILPPGLPHSLSVQSLPPISQEKQPIKHMSVASSLNDNVMAPNPVWRSAPMVDPELLKGVSFGFTPPPTIADLQPMMGVIPDVIHLPSAPGPPFHLQACSWRSLLRLLARLDSTRLEPSVEALAIMKISEANLRTVVQFNKIEYSPNDWRVVIYLTIDHALPPSARNIWRYTNGDTTTLPYSYQLCSPPRVFQATDTTQFYTVPATAKSPFPTLPMAFSNLALYLQSVLQDSRKATGDSSGSGRRLAKMVDLYYPDEMRGTDEEGGREGGGIKRFWAGLRKTRERGRGGNEEMFDLVTPFRIDEYA